jgi:hypothetical protein
MQWVLIDEEYRQGSAGTIGPWSVKRIQGAWRPGSTKRIDQETLSMDTRSVKHEQ